jgi:hypothetical protein
MDEETKTEEKIKPTSNNSSTIGTISFIIIALFWWWLNYEPVNPQLFTVPSLDINTNLSEQDFSKNPFEREETLHIRGEKPVSKEDAREAYIEISKGLGGEEYHGCVFDYYMEKVGLSEWLLEMTKFHETKKSSPLMKDAANACVEYANETIDEMNDEYYQWLESKGYDEHSFENFTEWLETKGYDDAYFDKIKEQFK